MQIEYENQYHRDLYTKTSKNLKKNELIYREFLKKYPEYQEYKLEWLRSRDAKVGPISLGTPWINFASLKWLASNVKRNSRVFEFGAGGSTLFFANKCGELVSVEHDSNWFAEVQKKLLMDGKKNLTLRFRKFFQRNKAPHLILIEPEECASKNPILSGVASLKHLDFSQYVNSITDYPKNYFDFILVDGRARVNCFERAWPHLRKGGHLILDNSDYLRYQGPLDCLEKKLQSYEKLAFLSPGPCSGVIGWKTSVYTKR